MKDCPVCKQPMPESDTVEFEHLAGVLRWSKGGVRLAPQQADIFYVLWDRRPDFTTMDRICMRVAGASDVQFDERHLRVQISLIRRLLRESGAPVQIVTQRQRGYGVLVL